MEQYFNSLRATVSISILQINQLGCVFYVMYWSSGEKLGHTNYSWKKPSYRSSGDNFSPNILMIYKQSCLYFLLVIWVKKLGHTAKIWENIFFTLTGYCLGLNVLEIGPKCCLDDI
jgi:hypothetical protein